MPIFASQGFRQWKKKIQSKGLKDQLPQVKPEDRIPFNSPTPEESHKKNARSKHCKQVFYLMITPLKQSLWKHFAGAIDMIPPALMMWPDALWTAKPKFFYTAYHILVFLDYYLTIPPVHFRAFLSYTLVPWEEKPADCIDDVVPDKIYTRVEMLAYVTYCREKCRRVIADLTEENLWAPWVHHTPDEDHTLSGQDALTYHVLDILFYNLRHVQHHVAQLNLILRQTLNQAPDYVSHAEDPLY